MQNGRRPRQCRVPVRAGWAETPAPCSRPNLSIPGFLECVVQGPDQSSLGTLDEQAPPRVHPSPVGADSLEWELARGPLHWNSLFLGGW